MRIKGTGLLLAALLLIVSGCQSSAGQGGVDESADQRLLVYTSFYTMAEFTRQVAGERAEIVNLVSSGGEPHHWEPSPQDVAGLEKADVLVLNGAGFEHWADGVLSALNNEGLVVVDASAGITLLESGDGHAEDPHVWLSPARAALQVEAIRDGLTKADPEGAEEYAANCAAYRQELETLDREYRETLEPLPGKEIVVAHQAFGYLCAEYGLTQVAAQGLSPDGEPDPAQMAEVVAYSRENEIRVIFFEELASPKVAEAIAREIGAETAVLSPLEGLSPEQQANGDDYLSVMRLNLQELKKALE